MATTSTRAGATTPTPPSDETESHHDRATAARRRRADPIAILDGAQLKTPGRSAPGTDRSGCGAGGDQQPIVGEAPAALELDELLPGVDLRGPHPSSERDALVRRNSSRA